MKTLSKPFNSHQGKQLLRNLDVGIIEKLLKENEITRCIAESLNNSADESDTSKLLDSVRQTLLDNKSKIALDMEARNAFLEEFPNGFEAKKVITRETFDSYYAERYLSPHPEGDFDLEITIDSELIDQEPIRATPAPKICASVRLCPPNDEQFFFTSAEWWDANVTTKENKATYACDQIGLPYSKAVDVVVLNIGKNAIQWKTCQRPHVLHALWHSRFHSWDDNLFHIGHAASLESAKSGNLGKGAPEWICASPNITVVNDNITCTFLSITTENYAEDPDQEQFTSVACLHWMTNSNFTKHYLSQDNGSK